MFDAGFTLIWSWEGYRKQTTFFLGLRVSVALPILNIDVAAFTDEEADDGAPALDGSDLESTDTITVLPVIICT